MTEYKPRLGTWCLLNDPTVIEILAEAEFDFCIIDFEHGYHDYNNLPNLLRTAKAHNITAFVRPPCLDESYILRILDSGASGLLVPNIKSYNQVKELINFSYYPPIGQRGHSPFTRAGRFTHIDATSRMMYLNSSLSLGILIEGNQVLSDLNSIFTDFGEYLSIIYIGLYDLAKSVGTPGDLESDELKNAVQHIASECKASGLELGILANNSNMLKSALDLGATFICYQNDTGILHEAGQDIAQAFKSFV